MSRLDPGKLHVRFLPGAEPDGPVAPRCYTLTHSDATGDLFLTIGAAHDKIRIAGRYTRLLRDEVLAEWHADCSSASLHVHCHVSGGVVLGTAAWRDAIFRRELPLVLEAFRHGDSCLFDEHPELDNAVIEVHFHSSRSRFDRTESWGSPKDYQMPASSQD